MTRLELGIFFRRLYLLPIGLCAFTFLLGFSDRTKEVENKLSNLGLFNRVILLVKQEYVDPSRINAKAILIASLEALEKRIPEVVVSIPVDNVLLVQAGEAKRKFTIKDIDSLWGVSFLLKDILAFIETNIDSNVSSAELEYVCINGMLATLDPHSLLLEPRNSREMKVKTKGEFGGLGVVISMRDGNLTIVNAMEQGPAFQAGLKAHDRIIKIDGIVADNIGLDETVEVLRGKPGTTVNLTIIRKGESVQRVVPVTRAVIVMDTVIEQLLKDNIAYVRIKSFHSNTAVELKRALNSMRKSANGNLKGLILDLRNNPGGLLSESVAVVDLFLAEGPVVVTKGAKSAQQDTELARADPDDDLALPIVVLVNGGSASASEIVAGALKYRGRGIVIGQRSFGKGSVQMLYDFPDGSSLKLTIAEYFAAGAKSIQAGGITPDLRLRPIFIDNLKTINLFADRQTREENLTAHLDRNSTVTGEPSQFSIDYISRELEADVVESRAYSSEYFEDGEILIATKILAATAGPKSSQLLEAAEQIAKSTFAERSIEIEAGLKKIGIDWSIGSANNTPPRVHARILSNPTVSAGNELKIDVEITNLGKQPLYRVHGVSDSATPFFADREIVFGRILPGEKRVQQLAFTVPADVITRRDLMRINLRANEGEKLETIQVPLQIVGNERAVISYRINKIVKRANNSVELAIGLENTGIGVAQNLMVMLKALDPKVTIDYSQHKVGKFAAKSQKEVRFILGNIDHETTLKMQIIDSELGDYWSTEIALKPESSHGESVLITPPKITIGNQQTQPLSTSASTFQAKIRVDSDRALLDVYLVVNDQQVVYRNYAGKSTKRVSLNEKISLNPGVNIITMVARENREFGQTKSFTVFSEKGDPLTAKGESLLPLSLNGRP